MAIGVRCLILSCGELLEGAEHWEDARDKMRAHFRMEHPTKVLNERTLENTFVQWNLTLDEYFDSYWGGDWRNMHLTDRQVVDVCRSIRDAWQSYNPEMIVAAVELAQERGTELDPFDPANPGPAVNRGRGGNVDVFIPFDEEIPEFDPGNGGF